MKLKIGIGIAAAVIAVVAAAGVMFWYAVLRGDSPAEVSLAEALGSIAAAPAGSGASATSPASTGSSAAEAGSLDGKWVPDTTQTTFLGYRVNEQLVGIGTTTAVGRTSAVTGSVTIADSKVTAATVVGDLTKLASDKPMRDGQLRNQAIETNRYPTATFELTTPVELPDNFATGATLSTTLKGKLTLHGVTRQVEIPVEGQLKGGLLVVVGSLNVQFSDYNISKPSGASVLSIEDHGVMELQLVLKR